MITLREFAYIDESSVENYLSTIEDGLTEYVIEQSTDSSPQTSFKVSLGDLQKILIALGFPVPEVGFERVGKAEELLVNTSKKPTVQSQFNQLYKYLDSVIQPFENLNGKNWKKIEQGQFLSFSGDISLPRNYQMTNLSKVGAGLADLNELFNPGYFEENEEDAKIRKQMEGYAEQADKSSTTNIYIIPEKSPNSSTHYLVSKIIHKYLKDTTLYDLNMNTYKILGRVEKVLKSTETYEVFDATFKQMGRALSRKEKRNMENLSDVLEEARGPAVIIKPIAIYTD